MNIAWKSRDVEGIHSQSGGTSVGIMLQLVTHIFSTGNCQKPFRTLDKGISITNHSLHALIRSVNVHFLGSF